MICIYKVKPKWKIPKNLENLWEGLKPTTPPLAIHGSVGWNPLTVYILATSHPVLPTLAPLYTLQYTQTTYHKLLYTLPHPQTSTPTLLYTLQYTQTPTYTYILALQHRKATPQATLHPTVHPNPYPYTTLHLLIPWKHLLWLMLDVLLRIVTKKELARVDKKIFFAYNGCIGNGSTDTMFIANQMRYNNYG